MCSSDPKTLKNNQCMREELLFSLKNITNICLCKMPDVLLIFVTGLSPTMNVSKESKMISVIWEQNIVCES